MKLQVLVSAMGRKNPAFLSDMNIKSEVIVVNQCEKFGRMTTTHKGERVLFMSFPERGVGLSRNNALMRADADICLIADEDVKYENDYVDTVLEAFKNNPKADMILFNVPSDNPERPEYTINRVSRVRWYNSLRYGAIRIAFRLDRQRNTNVYFSLLFGGGAKYSSGEDSLFIYQSIKKGMKVYTSPKVIGHARQETSTWFTGYNDKFFYDKGIFYKTLSPRFGRIFAIQYAVRKYKSFNTSKSLLEVIHLINEGVKQYEQK